MLPRHAARAAAPHHYADLVLQLLDRKARRGHIDEEDGALGELLGEVVRHLEKLARRERLARARARGEALVYVRLVSLGGCALERSVGRVAQARVRGRAAREEFGVHAHEVCERARRAARPAEHYERRLSLNCAHRAVECTICAARRNHPDGEALYESVDEGVALTVARKHDQVRHLRREAGRQLLRAQLSKSGDLGVGEQGCHAQCVRHIVTEVARVLAHRRADRMAARIAVRRHALAAARARRRAGLAAGLVARARSRGLAGENGEFGLRHEAQRGD